jgi:hypothetical protein
MSKNHTFVVQNISGYVECRSINSFGVDLNNWETARLFAKHVKKKFPLVKGVLVSVEETTATIQVTISPRMLDDLKNIGNDIVALFEQCQYM